MGGRGGRSGIHHGGGSLRDLLNTQGRVLSPSEAMPLANPHYSEDYLYQVNCQRCVWAYEMLRRGYSAEAAQAYSSEYEGTVDSIRDMWMSAPNADSRNFMMLNRTTRDVNEQYKIAEAKLQEWGEGSRAIMANVWKNGGGHIWNVEYSGGKVHYYDAQIGKEVDIANRNNRSSTLDIFARVDDLDVPNKVMNAVLIKKRRKIK